MSVETQGRGEDFQLRNQEKSHGGGIIPNRASGEGVLRLRIDQMSLENRAKFS